jgi:hypothetical protein
LIELGKWGRALDVLEPVELEWGRKTQRPATVRTLKVRGDALLGLGRLREAEEQYALLLPVAEQVFGKDHPWVTDLEMSMARVPSAVG